MTGLYGEKGNIKQMALEALRLVNMKEYKDTLIGKLSGGQLQRVMAARVLAGGHDLLLLDEPMTGLDAAASQEMYKILCSLVRENGTTCLMISHDMSKLPEMPDSRILCLEYGNIIELDYEQFVRERASRHTHPKREKL
jgi:zinc transport system ATP-binding protein